MAISGDTIVVGANGEDSNARGVNGNQSDNSANYAGAAYVFVRNGVTWSQQAYLKASNTDIADFFGWSVAISSDTIVVGAKSADITGAVYVFVRSGATWSQHAYLKASNADIYDYFGESVAISGDTIVVGAIGEDSNAGGVNGNQSDNSADWAGAAYVFVRSGATRSQQAYLKASNADSYDFFGNSVAISGDTIVVGASEEDSNAKGVNGNQSDNSATGAGAAYVLLTNSTNIIAPTSVTATPFSTTQINLSWTDVAINETGYRVARRLTSGTTWAAWADIATLAAGTTSYNNTGLTAATWYTYRISAIAPGGTLVSAGDVSATTFAATAVPTGVTATPFSSTQINLKWNDIATNEIGYQITALLLWPLFSKVIAVLPANTTTYQDTRLTASTSYKYVVSAVAPGDSLVSAAPVSATTFGPTSAPTGVVATPFSFTRIDLKWVDTATNESGYQIERRLTSGTSWTNVATLAANFVSYSNNGLTPSTGYTYRVSAIAPGGALVNGATASATTFDPTSAPTGLAATPFSSTQINLRWTDAATNETGYRISRRLTSGTVWTDLPPLPSNTISYISTGLVAATGYTYRVSAIAPGGALVSNGDVSATTFAVTAVPTGVSATPFSSTQINLKWTDAATNETGYQIDGRLASMVQFVKLATLSANSNSYSSTGLLPSTGFVYRVSAIAPGGSLVSAATVSATTFGPTDAPRGLTATAFSSTQINLKWADVAVNETGYRIESRPTSGTAWTVLATIAANSKSYNNTGLTPSTGYTYRVSAVAPGGALVSGGTAAATTFGPTSAPTGLTATPFSSTQINLSWTDTATNETGYRISRRLTAGTVWTDVATLAANSTIYNNMGLTAATGFTYRVSAIAPGGALVSAGEVSATTFGPTSAPTGLTATPVSQTQINLSWTDTATNETGYRVSRRLTAGTVWVDVAILPANSNSYNNTGLTAATGYAYNVSAIAPGGALVSAGVASAKTFP